MATDSVRWREALSRCLESLEREQASSACPLVDHEIVASAPAGSDEISVWFICRNESERSEFAASELNRNVAALKRKLVAAGFHEEALASLTVRLTSREVIARNGGRVPSFG